MEAKSIISSVIVVFFVFGLNFYCLAGFPMSLRFFIKNIISKLRNAFSFSAKVFRRESVHFNGAIKTPGGLGEIEICSAQLGAETNSMKITFPNNGTGNGGRRINNKKFINCTFSHEVIENYTFNSCLFVGCYFIGSRFVGVEIHNCEFHECIFLKSQFNSTYIDPDLLVFSWYWRWDRANVNAWLYQALYRNSRDMHQEEFAMKADRKFQTYRRYQYIRGKNLRPLKFVRSLIYELLTGCGYGIANALVVTFAIIGIFAFFMRNSIGRISVTDGSFLDMIYFSVVSFTTVGYGDVAAKNETLPIILTIIFLLVSVAWCAVVTAIIVKRIVK